MDPLHNSDVAASCFMVDEDDLLNFSLDGEEGNNNIKDTSFLKDPSFSSSSSNNLINHQDDLSRSSSFPEFEEEEDLEWLSNKDAFPAVETCFDLLSETPDLDGLNQQSPVSVLENSSSSSSISNGSNSGNGSAVMGCCGSLQVPTSFPVRPRSQRRRRKRRLIFGELPSHQQWLLWNQVNIKNGRRESVLPLLPARTNGSGSIGRRCLHCQADQTPQWRAGPMGPKTLCNACGVRYKSGRLLPEYRPASSPTFSATLHSNSHRKIVEMRRKNQLRMGGIMANEACGYSVG